MKNKTLEQVSLFPALILVFKKQADEIEVYLLFV